MNGRCETDPFDQAADVCGSCYGEFCQSCLVETKGRKHPICRDCAVILSGVRPGAKPPRRGSKKTASQRRAGLKAAPVEESFQYFDAEPVAPTPGGEDPVPAVAAGPETTDGEAETVDAAPHSTEAGVAPTTAVDQLDRIRAGGLGSGADRGDEDDLGREGEEGPAPEAVDDPLGGEDEVADFRRPRPFIESDDDGPGGMAALRQHHEAQQARNSTQPVRSTRPAPSTSGPRPSPGQQRQRQRQRQPQEQPAHQPQRRRDDPIPTPNPAPAPAPAAAVTPTTAVPQTAAVPQTSGTPPSLPRRRDTQPASPAPTAQWPGTQPPAAPPPGVQSPGAPAAPGTPAPDTPARNAWTELPRRQRTESAAGAAPTPANGDEPAAAATAAATATTTSPTVASSPGPAPTADGSQGPPLPRRRATERHPDGDAS